jgi:hypothetical protein
MPLALVFGPASLGDIDQHYSNTSSKHGRLGQMMWLAIQWAQVKVGMGLPLLGEPGRFLPRAVGTCFLPLVSSSPILNGRLR